MRLGSWYSRSVRRTYLDAHLTAIAPLFQGKVLEIGGGRHSQRGHFARPIQDTAGWTWIDLDLKTRPHVLADAQRLPIAGASFDTVACLEVLEYIPDAVLALSEMRRVLKADGRLVLSVPFLHRRDSSSDRWRYTDQGIRYLLRQANLRVTSLEQQGGALAVMANVLWSIALSPRRRLLRFVMKSTAYPLLRMLVALDGPTRARIPALRTFSTGFLVTAEQEQDLHP